MTSTERGSSASLVGVYFKICGVYAKFLNFLITLLGFSLIFAVAVQVAGRYIWFIPPYLWTEELTNFSLIWSIFIGSIIGVKDGKHFLVDIFQFRGQGINPHLNFFLRILYYLTLLVMTYVFTYYGYIFFVKWGMIQSSDITGINKGWLYVSVPVTGVSWLLFIIEGVIKEFFMGKLAVNEGEKL